MNPTGRLHVLTDTELQSRFSAVELTRLALAGGADTIQFRQKTGSTRELIDLARRLKELCTAASVPFIVNDRVDVAIASQADGVHLGRDDFPIPLARALLGPDRTIGGSASTPDQARQCIEEGADYVGFGPVYCTDSKQDAAPASGLDTLRTVVRAVPVPVIAIGGISLENTPAVAHAGAGGIAVISAICCQSDPEAATRAILRALDISWAGDGHE